ncbi:hypothetical protein SALBM311S_11390 [Streptomyces alboniger]
MRERHAAQDARRAREFDAFVAGAAGRLLHAATLLTAEDPRDNPHARRLLTSALAHTYACWDRFARRRSLRPRAPVPGHPVRPRSLAPVRRPGCAPPAPPRRAGPAQPAGTSDPGPSPVRGGRRGTGGGAARALPGARPRDLRPCDTDASRSPAAGRRGRRPRATGRSRRPARGGATRPTVPRAAPAGDAAEALERPRRGPASADGAGRRRRCRRSCTRDVVRRGAGCCAAGGRAPSDVAGAVRGERCVGRVGADGAAVGGAAVQTTPPLTGW